MRLDIDSSLLIKAIDEEIEDARSNLEEEKKSGGHNNSLVSQYMGYIDGLEWTKEQVTKK